MKRIALALFVAVSVAELASQIFQLEQVHHIVKPLLMLFLAVYYYMAVEPEERSNLVLVALIFSFLGDSFLLYDAKDPLYFMLGLGSFLLAHATYIVVFRQHRYDEEESSLYRVQKARMSFPVILASTGLVIVLFPRLGDLRIPVLVYAGVLMFMVLNSVFRFQRTVDASFWRVFGGAILFLISDSLLAINKFLEPLNHAGVLIMSTYILAQYLIIEGLIKHQQEGAAEL